MFAAGLSSRLLVPTRYAVERSAAHKAIQLGSQCCSGSDFTTGFGLEVGIPATWCYRKMERFFDAEILFQTPEKSKKIVAAGKK